MYEWGKVDSGTPMPLTAKELTSASLFLELGYDINMSREGAVARSMQDKIYVVVDNWDLPAISK